MAKSKQQGGEFEQFEDFKADPPKADPPKADDAAAEVERLKAELAAARKDAEYAYSRADQVHAENVRLKTAASAGSLYPPGSRFRVSVKDGPAAVVEPTAGEHPMDAYKRVTGVIQSQHPFDVSQVAQDAECRVLKPGE